VIELIALYLAGLSFFFTGVGGISDNLRQMSGQRFRRLLAHTTHHPVLAALLGAVLGTITQSASVVAFVLSGMVASGLMPLVRALIVMSFANVGTALLVFIAALDLHLPILFLIGICGIILAFKLARSWKPGIAGLLSVGLVFFGLDMMKQAFHPIAGSSELSDVGRFFNFYPDAAFFLGVGLRSVIHSSSAVAAITITINKDGVLGEFPALLSMAGLGVGTALASWFLSSNLTGIPRQIAVFQAVTNIGGGVLVGVLLIVEHMSNLPLLIALTHQLSGDISGRMALMYLFFNLAIVGVSMALLPWVPKFLARICPPTPEEDLSRPQYLHDDALRSPETALDLVALEQMRLVRAFEQFLEIARGQLDLQLAPLHHAAGELSKEISAFLESLVKLPIAADLAAHAISFQRKEDTLRALEENLFLFCQTLSGQTGDDSLGNRLIESLDTLVLSAIDALESKQPADIDLLVQLTDDRGTMMERLRSRLVVAEGEDAASIGALHYATTLFERNVWLLRQLALWMHEDAKAGEVA
jgi:phosphate:Na+ symporter